MIAFHEHEYSSSEIKVVTEVLKRKWITGGPETLLLEEELSDFLKIPEVVALSSATAGLFLSLKAFGVGPGDEVITTPYSFVATANVILQCEARVVFADIGKDYNLDPLEVAKKITSKTKAIIAMDYGGYPCDYLKLRQALIQAGNTFTFQWKNKIQEELGRPLLLADSAHAIGTLPDSDFYGNGDKKPFFQNILADIHSYSFHAVKNITSGEGGAVGVVNKKLVEAGFIKLLKKLRLHGLNRDVYSREQQRIFFYDMDTMGYKCNLTEMQAALVRVQLKKIDKFKQKKMRFKKYYDDSFKEIPQIKLRPLNLAWRYWHIHPHLYTLEYQGFNSLMKREDVLQAKENFFQAALNEGLALNFHYLPIPLMSYYLQQGYSIKKFPVTRMVYSQHFSLPFHTQLKLSDAKRVVTIIKRLI